MRKLILILSLFCFLFLGMTDTLIAQDTESRSSFYRPRVAFKFVPLPLIDYTPAVQFAIEIGTFKNQTLELEYGYVFNLHSYRNSEADFTGQKLIASYRYYAFQKETGPKNLFFALRYMRKEVNVMGMDFVSRAGGAFQEFIEIEVQNKTNAYFVMAGYVFPMFKKFRVETALGIGARFLNVSLNNVPDDVEYDGTITSNFFNPVSTVGDYRYPGVIISAKIIYPFF